MNHLISIDLDCLLDTRLGVITAYRPDLIDVIMQSGYRNRQSDDLSLLVSDFPQAWFAEAYQNRGKDVLVASKLTPSVTVLKAMTEALEVQSITSPLVSAIVLEVNIYPYELTPVECETLKDLTMVYSSLITKVNIVSISLAELTPNCLHEEYSGLIMYDFATWLRMHIDALQHCKIPTVTIMTPMRYEGNIPSDIDRTIDTRGPVNLFSITEEFLLEFVGLNYLDMEYFSIIDAAKLRNGTI